MTATATKPSDYVEIAKWGHRLGSMHYYIQDQQLKAFADKAPLNAAYFSDKENRWITTDDVKASQEESARQTKIRDAAPELLAACKSGLDALLAALPHADRIHDILQPRIEQLRAAIAKATELATP
jgi:hypothetical protein